MHSVPKGSETHFKVVVISDMFKDKSLLERHRTVNQLLDDELKNGVHALSIQGIHFNHRSQSKQKHQSNGKPQERLFHKVLLVWVE